MALNGAKSIVTFFSFPSSLITDPQYTTSPLGGTRLYSLSRCCTEVMAPSTDSLFTRLLIDDAVPYSSASIFVTRAIWSAGPRP